MESIPVHGFPDQLKTIYAGPFCVAPNAPEIVSDDIPDTQFGQIWNRNSQAPPVKPEKTHIVIIRHYF